MKIFSLGLGFIVAFLANANTGICSTYYGKSLVLRAARTLVDQPVIVSNLRPLRLQKITHIDDAWRIGHWMADADNFYTRKIELKQNKFPEMPLKRLLIGSLTVDLYKLLEETSPSSTLIHLRTLLFQNHYFHESVENLVCSGYRKQEFPIREAMRLGGLLYKLPRG